MAVRTAERVSHQEEVTVKAPPEEAAIPAVATGTVMEASEKAAERYAPDEVEKHAQAIGEAWLAKLNQQEKEYKKYVKELAGAAQLEAAEPISPPGFAWWSLLLAGPFQSPSGGGPFRPSKVIRAGESAFFLAVLRRNRALIGGIPASTLMSAYDYTLRLPTVNVTNVASAPLFGPITNTFGPGIFGFLNLHIIPINTPAPPEGNPTLYQTHMVVDIIDPGLPFAGFNSWILDPDAVPAISTPTGFFIFSPALGGLVFVPQLPGTAAGLQHDTTAQWMVYRA